MDFGQLKIRDDDVDRLSTVFRQSLFSVRRQGGLVTRSFEDIAQEDPNWLVVIDDEYACHDGALMDCRAVTRV